MARQRYYSEPWRKHLEVFPDFTGGLNTVTSNDNLADNELTDLKNIDLGERGSLKRRHGMVTQITAPTAGKGQGYFRYYKTDGTFEEIIAVGGKLYKGGLELAITGLASFQATKQIEAVQYGTSLFIATGTELVEYDGTSAKVVTPYTPQPLEALYIGTNGLADNPDNYLSDGTATNLRIDGVTSDKRYGLVNAKTTFTIYVSKPDTMTVEYRWYYRVKGESTWTLGRDWGAKTCEFIPTQNTEYELDFYAREAATTGNGVRYIMPSYKVYETDKNDTISTATISSCNRILLHWDRLILYGDGSQAIYVSHIQNPRYFPTPNSLLFENERREDLTAIVKYRDMLVAFTPNSIQALYGKSPMDFVRVQLNTTIGCIAPFTAKAMGNYVAFLSREGVHILKSLGYTENRLNVEKIDSKIENLIEKHEDACALVADSQYHITFPQTKKRFRYYFDYKMWTKDESDKLDFSQIYHWNGDILGQSVANGNIFRFDETVFDDAGFIYEDLIETKYFDFGQPYHSKKLKELHMLVGHSSGDIDLSVFVYADAALIVDPDTSYASVDANGSIVWNASSSPNVEVEAGTTFGSWELGVDAWGNVEISAKELRLSGKCRRTKIVIKHTQANESRLLGLGYVMKLKKP